MFSRNTPPPRTYTSYQIEGVEVHVSPYTNRRWRAARSSSDFSAMARGRGVGGMVEVQTTTWSIHLDRRLLGTIETAPCGYRSGACIDQHFFGVVTKLVQQAQALARSHLQRSPQTSTSTETALTTPPSNP